MKKIIFALALSGALLVGCSIEENKSGASSGKGYKSKTYESVISHINEMAEKPWDKTAYLAIKEKQITLLTKNSEIVSATTLLESEYKKVLVRDAKKVLESGCKEGNPHKYLGELMKELKSYPDAPGLSEVQSLKKIHDEAVSFANSGIGAQHVSSFRDSYDYGYENQKMSKAKSYLNNSQVKCQSARQKLEKLSSPSSYNSRRKAYCEAITDAYCNQYNCKDENDYYEARSQLKVYPDGDAKKVWQGRMKEHYNEIKYKK